MIRALAAARPARPRAPLARAEPAAEAAKSYRIETAGHDAARSKAGEKGTLVLSIVPVGKVHVHPQAPLKITLEATPGLKLAKTSLGKADPVDPKADGPPLRGAVRRADGRRSRRRGRRSTSSSAPTSGA